MKIDTKVTNISKYISEKYKAVLKCSACNGEQMAGFKDIQTGQFIEVMAIRNGHDLDQFMEMYNLSTIIKEYYDLVGE